MTGAELFLAAAVLLSLCVAAGWMVGGMRRQPRSELPPATWWACPSCHSVNEGMAGPEEHCYRCGRVPDPGATQQLDTAAEFEVVQQFGSSRKGGWDREVHWSEEAPEAPAPDTAPTGEPRAGTGEASAGSESVGE